MFYGFTELLDYLKINSTDFHFEMSDKKNN